MYIISIDPGEINIGVVVLNKTTDELEFVDRINLRKGKKKPLSRRELGENLIEWLNNFKYTKNAIVLTEAQMRKKYIYFNGVLKGYFKDNCFIISPITRNRFHKLNVSTYEERKRKAIDIVGNLINLDGKLDDVCDALLQLFYFLKRCVN